MNMYSPHAFNLISKAHHILIIDSKNKRQTIYLDQDSYSVGRDLGHSIVFDSKKVSRHHATLVRKINPATQELCFWLIDGDLLGNKSHNGIFVNRKRCFVQLLQDGDIIYFTSDIQASYHCLTGQKTDEETTSQEHPQKFEKITISIDNPNCEELEEESIVLGSYAWHPSTKLPNSLLFKDYLRTALANSKRNHHIVAVVLLEVTNINVIQENHYISSEKLLKTVAKKLQTLVREGDIIAYWGKNQFAILFSNLQKKNIMIRLAQRIVKIFDEAWNIESQSLNLEASLGIAFYPEDGQNRKALLNSAKCALLLAKENSNYKYHFYDQKMNVKASILLKLAHRLDNAIKNNELLLYYQPQVNIKTQKIYALEALLRWRKNESSALLPHQFLPMLEESEEMISLNDWVLKTACYQLLNWQDQGLPLLPIAINLSPRQFYSQKLFEQVKTNLEKTQINPHYLQLEIAETTLMQNLIMASKIVKQLHQLGIKITIDDFGDGNTSLRLLQELRSQTLKISPILVQNLVENSQESQMISMMVAWGNSWGQTIVAKGVETQQQSLMLQQLQCHQMQGYLWSLPKSAEAITQYLTMQVAKQQYNTYIKSNFLLKVS